MISRYISLEKFCTCSKTYQQHSQNIDPYPWQPESHEAIASLFTHLLDPIIDQFGKDKFILTYGFCSVDLAKFLEKKDPDTGIKNGRICPKIDQHMAHEINSRGNYYCNRLGAAADFLIEGVQSSEVIALMQLMYFPYDRIYFYGNDRPIHISYGPQHSRHIWNLRSGKPRKYIN